MAFKTRSDGRVYPADTDYQKYLQMLLAGKRFEDLPPQEKAAVSFKADMFMRQQRRMELSAATARKFERRSMLTPADMAANRERLRTLAAKVSKRPKAQRMRYNEQLKRFEFVDA